PGLCAGFFIIRGETMSRRKTIAQVGDLITAVEADGSHSVWIIEKIRTFYLDIAKDGIVKSLPITDFNNLITADKIIKYKSYYKSNLSRL
ncbi:MAG: hypothetical protein ACKPFA_10535, partial [Dolichospermum sp.]